MTQSAKNEERVAGVTLDMEIHERVMGLAFDEWYASTPEGVTPHVSVGWECTREQAQEACDDAYGRANGLIPRAVVPSYSSDIAAAWLVVEKMRERLFKHGVALAGDVPLPWPDANYLSLVGLTGAQKNAYAATFVCADHEDWYENLRHDPRVVMADTAPLALCLSAIAAVSSPAGDLAGNQP